MPIHPAGDDPTRVRPGDEAAPGSPQSGEAICPSCGGSGQLDGAPCPECDGAGRITAIAGEA